MSRRTVNSYRGDIRVRERYYSRRPYTIFSFAFDVFMILLTYVLWIIWMLVRKR